MTGPGLTPRETSVTERPTTDELAHRIRHLERANAKMTAAVEPICADLAAELKLRLPYIEEADLAAVLMHLSSCLSGLIARFREGGLAEHIIGTVAANTLAIAGERMHRAARHTRRTTGKATPDGA